MAKLKNVLRIDVVWDIYLPNSIKSTARDKSGSGARRQVQPDVNVPTNWAELFQYLGQQTVSIAENNKVVISTINDLSVSSPPNIDLSEISPCNHEEADTRLLLHCYDASKQDIRRVMIQTVDTDVVVLALSMFKEMQLETLWIAFSSGKNFCYIPIHDIVE